MRNISILLSVLVTTFFSLLISNTPVARADYKANTTTIEEVMILINGLPKIAGYRDTLKPAIENQISLLGNDPGVSASNRQALRNGYDLTSQKFNLWVDMIKGDLLNPDSLRAMKNAPDSGAYFAKKYLLGYIDAINTYERHLKPVTDKIQASNKPVDPQLIMLGLEVTLKVVDLIKTWNEQKQFDRENALNILNLSINTLFADRLHMRPWSELVQLPLPLSTSISNSIALPVTLSNNVTKPDVVQPLPARYYIGPDQINVGQPTLACPLAGAFYLMKYEQSNVTPIPLTIGASKLTVEYDDYITGKAQPVEVKTTRFDASLKAGNYFRLHVTTGCYVYVFALNSDGTCVPVYPFNNLVGEVAHPLMSRDLTNSFVVPHQNPNIPNGVSMKTCSSCSEENLAIVFSRTEFSLSDLMFKASRLPGSLDQRLAALFTNQNLNPTDGLLQVQMGDKIQFQSFNPPPQSVVAFSIRVAITQ